MTVLTTNSHFPYSRFEKSFEKDGLWEVHTLSIKDAVMEDAGTYEVVASNRLGECAMAGTLAIVTEPPTFPVELQASQATNKRISSVQEQFLLKFV